MKNTFKEGDLPESFHRLIQNELGKRLTPAGMFLMHGMTGVGISPFLRFLSMRNDGLYIYLDVASLPHPTTQELFAALLTALGNSQTRNQVPDILSACKRLLQKIAEKERVIIIINRFDRLEDISDVSLGNIRTLRHGMKDRVSIILSIHRPLIRFAEPAMRGGNLESFTNSMYFVPYTESDIRHLLRLYGFSDLVSTGHATEIYALSGGHYQLFRLVQHTRYKENPLKDPAIQFALKGILSSFDYAQRKILEKVAFQKSISSIDEELLSIGIIQQTDSGYRLFSLLVEAYVKQTSQSRLPAKEAKLLSLLKKHMGKVVTKEVIFKTLWSEEDDEYGSDWALNALIYRMRKNPLFFAKGYTIENYKKIGYSLKK